MRPTSSYVHLHIVLAIIVVGFDNRLGGFVVFSKNLASILDRIGHLSDHVLNRHALTAISKLGPPVIPWISFTIVESVFSPWRVPTFRCFGFLGNYFGKPGDVEIFGETREMSI